MTNVYEKIKFEKEILLSTSKSLCVDDFFILFIIAMVVLLTVFSTVLHSFQILLVTPKTSRE